MPRGMYHTAQPYRALLVLGSAAFLAPSLTDSILVPSSIAFPPRHYTRLAIKGLPLGAYKCTYLAEQVIVLGLELEHNESSLGKKVLAM